MPFEELIGHEPVVRLLTGQIERERLASTYLFVGPEGIGKRALALEFAKALECQGPDLLVVTLEGDSREIKIEQVRQMESWMMLTPYGGKRKAVILDPAEALTEESTHACLKILEEPPARSIFILLASAPHRLPVTLLSRCHKIRCAPQGTDRVAAALQKEGVDPGKARMLAICSGGRIGLARQFHQSDRLAKRNTALDQILAALKRKDLENPFPKATRREVEEYVEWYASWWRDLLVLKLQGDLEWVVHQDRLDQLRKMAAAVPAGMILEQVDRSYEVQEAVQRNANLRTALALLLSHG